MNINILHVSDLHRDPYSQFVDGHKESVVIVPGNHDISDHHFRESLERVEIPSGGPRELIGPLFTGQSNLRWSWDELALYQIKDFDMYSKRFLPFVTFYDSFYGGSRRYSANEESQFDISQGAAGADQPLHLQVQILVLRLSHRDPGVTVERHPAAPLAGMGKSIPSCQGEINRVFQPPPELRQGGIPSRGRKQGCFQPPRPAGAGTGRPSRLRDHAAGPAVQLRYVGEVRRLGNHAGRRAGENGVKRTAGDHG